MYSLRPYSKFLVALLGAAASVVSQFYGDNSTVQVVLAVLTALGVYRVSNE